MSEEFNNEQHPIQEDAEYLEMNEVEQVYDQNQDDVQPEDMDDDLDMEDDRVEIDMTNNSKGYYDLHKDSVFNIDSYGGICITGSGDDTAHVWEINNNAINTQTNADGEPVERKSLFEIKHNESVIGCYLTRPKGLYLISGDMNGLIKIYKTIKKGTWELIHEIQQVEELQWLKINESVEGMFAFGGTDGSVWVYQLTKNDLNLVMSGFSHQQDCTNGEFINYSEDDIQLLSLSVDGSIVLWSVYTGEAIMKWTESNFKSHATPQWISLQISPKSDAQPQRLAAVGSTEGALTLLNLQSHQVLYFNPAVIENITEHEEMSDLSIESISWLITPGKPALLVVGIVRGDLIVYDIPTFKIRSQLKLEEAITKTYISSGTNNVNKRLFVSSMDGKVYTYDPYQIANEQSQWIAHGHNMGVLDFAVDEKNNLLITAGDDGVSLIFEL
ncbi:hypothetical protein FOG48_02758 [Hanseniaspora uvarum]|nr:hypothetical protein FOG48_02758 [Hanseniaspora uvarum]